ncbi:MAG: hypothetical protein EXS35_16115 [Pedosphaera sp.]|nr:hypothetical protein [Pedosphaera sp.]
MSAAFPPYFLSWGFTNGVFQMEVIGQPGPEYVILGSSNLVQWTPIGTNAGTFTPFIFFDPGSDSNRTRFYRVQFQP